MMRRLIVCFDGTWNTPDSGSNPTNVVKILRAIRNQAGGVSQIVFYDKGVGTGDAIDKLRGGALGAGLTANVVDGYRFLGNNYDPGDQIFIFGFSRGAYTARSLAGFIGLAGIIRPTMLGKGLLDALAIYRDIALDKDKKRQAVEDLNLDRYTDIPIACIGVWDTVGSLGVPGDLGPEIAKKYYFSDVQLSPLVNVALHAVAIDEKRSAFAPTLWVRKKGAATPPNQKVEQVWFPGVHSNVGGSYKDAGLSDTALDWMIKRVNALAGLEFDAQYIAQNIDSKPLGVGRESRSAPYFTSRVYPYQRLINQEIPEGTVIGDWFRKTFPRYDRRNIPKPELNVETVKEMLHIAALERWDKEVVHDDKERRYRPSNLEAAIRAHHAGRSIPVVGWDGKVIPDADVPWPAV